MTRIDGITARAYRVPTAAPREGDGTLTWDGTTIVVVHARAADETGIGWTYADGACVPLVERTLAPLLVGEPATHVPARWTAMQRQIRNLGRPGLVSCAMSAVDIALWDLAARLLGVPVTTLLGRVHDTVALYGSGGFTTQSEDELTEQLDTWVHKRHIPRVKIKIGESWGGAVDRDLARVRLARDVVGAETELYVDANGGYSVGQARRVARLLEEHDVRWFEEPVSSDDLTGLATVRDSTAIDVTAGEYGYDLPYFARMVGSVDCLQVDVTRCGGFTEWRPWRRPRTWRCPPTARPTPPRTPPRPPRTPATWSGSPTTTTSRPSSSPARSTRAADPWRRTPAHRASASPCGSRTSRSTRSPHDTGEEGMRTDTSHAEALALRDYVEAVAEAVGVETAATWHEYGPPSAAYVALATRWPVDPRRLLMLQWTSESGWALAVEPDGAEPPDVLAAWPDTVHLAPAELAAGVRRVLALPVTLPIRVPASEEKPCAR
jgi:L-alanine-DL-glutamate epimerase-like enolase superfamily enzyme